MLSIFIKFHSLNCLQSPNTQYNIVWVLSYWLNKTITKLLFTFSKKKNNYENVNKIVLNEADAPCIPTASKASAHFETFTAVDQTTHHAHRRLPLLCSLRRFFSAHLRRRRVSLDGGVPAGICRSSSLRTGNWVSMISSYSL